MQRPAHLGPALAGARRRLQSAERRARSANLDAVRARQDIRLLEGYARAGAGHDFQHDPAKLLNEHGEPECRRCLNLLTSQSGTDACRGPESVSPGFRIAFARKFGHSFTGGAR